MEGIHDLYDQILSEGSSPRTLFLVLSELKSKGELSRVIQECIRALHLYPRDIPLRHLLAEACLQNGWLSRAESEVEALTAQIEPFISAYRLQAEIYLRAGRREEARSALHAYLAHRPEDPEALALLERLHPPQAGPSTETLPEPPVPGEPSPETVVEPPLPEIATSTLAEVYFGQGQIEEAIATYEKVLAQNPQAEKPRLRLEELRTFASQGGPPEEKEPEDPARKKKEKMIAVLETWRARLREAP